MTTDTVTTIDADAHVTEPPDLWTSRVSSKWGDLVPHVRLVDRTTKGTSEASVMLGSGRSDGQIDAWFVGDTMVAPACASAMGADWDEPFPSHPPTFADAHPAAYDGAARLEVMDAGGIAAQVLYPNVAGFGSQRFRTMAEQELALECVRAYNDFLIDWIQPAPERFVAIAAIPYWNLDAAVAEVERAAALGHRGIIFPNTPHDWDVPYLADRHWDPLWSAAQACGLSVSFHAGSGNFTSNTEARRIALEGPSANYVRTTTAVFFDAAASLCDLLCSGILPRFPDLKFVLVESGIGWIPFLLESVDHHFALTRAHEHRPEFQDVPSSYYYRQVYSCFWFERVAPQRLLDQVGVDNVLFETDFPHPTGVYGDAVQQCIARGLEGQPDDVVRKITYDNAAALYRVPPLAPV